MSGTTFLYDLRDLKFVLKEWLDMDKLLSCPAYKDYYGLDDIDPIIDTTFKICRDEVAVINNDA
ncbi:MAG TPA: acyl-CoA dehydrogenase N-terminal domain-containing protein, partial [Syntrophomonadaceae bacterium]|nr:acyl-CoA dehydrogenase N-terminal domain-containing protein [Syntrophomonadaceae bacterium]